MDQNTKCLAYVHLTVIADATNLNSKNNFFSCRTMEAHQNCCINHSNQQVFAIASNADET